MGSRYLGLLLFADNCWIVAMSPGELQTMATAWNEQLKSSGLHIDWGRGVVVFDGTRQPGSKHHCVGNNDHSTNTRGRFRSSGFDTIPTVIKQYLNSMQNITPKNTKITNSIKTAFSKFPVSNKTVMQTVFEKISLSPTVIKQHSNSKKQYLNSIKTVTILFEHCFKYCLHYCATIVKISVTVLNTV